SEDTFDEFDYDDEELDEADGYFTEGTPDDELFRNPKAGRKCEQCPFRTRRNARACAMLLARRDTFAHSMTDLGKTNVVEHEINT
ncbi:6182_t:CDS:2, partial [Dentiscutata heterogama]